MSGTVQMLVDGVKHGDPVHMADGDQILFTMPGNMVNGRLVGAEERIAGLERKLRATEQESARHLTTIRAMVEASSLDEAVGIAYRSGALYEEPY